jgi:SPX domain protein involved in polyphosphate accumulation
VPEDLWRDIVKTPAGPSLLKTKPEAVRGAERFVELVHTYHLHPVMLVEYDREAYISTVDNYARLTFDRRIVCQTKDTLDLVADTKRWRSVDHPAQTTTFEPVCVLELKFERLPPRWMVDLVKRHELVRMSFSKYCYSVNAQMLLPTSRVSFPPRRLFV